MIAAKGSGNVDILLSALTDHVAIPDMAKAVFEQMGRHVIDLDVKIQAIDRQLLEQHKANEVSQRLAAIPGIGPITAITMALSVNPANFESGRHFAAWLGLTPKEHSTGGKVSLRERPPSWILIARPALRKNNLKVESVHDGDNGHKFACEAAA